MKRPLLLISASLALFSTAQAHSTGHEGGFIETARHFLTQPDHLLIIVAAVALVAVLATKQLRSAKK